MIKETYLNIIRFQITILRRGERRLSTKMNAIDWVARILVIIGAINWGLASFSTVNLVEYLSVSWLITLVYALVGLSGIWELIALFKK